MEQYLNKENLLEVFSLKKTDQINVSDLVTMDSYNEQKIKEKIMKFEEKDIVLLLKCSLNSAIIGTGNKKYGFIKNGKEILEIKDIYKRLGVQHNGKQDEKYDDDTLTHRRLTRFFRHQISAFILKNKKPSYLWRKYSDKNIEMVGVCFPGAEHLVNEIQAKYLLNVYSEVDKRHNTKFVERMKRIFDARNISY